MKMQKKKYLEGNPSDPRDLYHETFKMKRIQDAQRLSDYMKSQNLDTSWWDGVKVGKNDSYVLLSKNDPNGQVCRFEIKIDSNGQRHMVRDNIKS
jgi:hypothetical protein